MTAIIRRWFNKLALASFIALAIVSYFSLEARNPNGVRPVVVPIVRLSANWELAASQGYLGCYDSPRVDRIRSIGAPILEAWRREADRVHQYEAQLRTSALSESEVIEAEHERASAAAKERSFARAYESLAATMGGEPPQFHPLVELSALLLCTSLSEDKVPATLKVK